MNIMQKTLKISTNFSLAITGIEKQNNNVKRPTFRTLGMLHICKILHVLRLPIMENGIYAYKICASKAWYEEYF